LIDQTGPHFVPHGGFAELDRPAGSDVRQFFGRSTLALFSEQISPSPHLAAGLAVREDAARVKVGKTALYAPIAGSAEEPARL